MKQTYTATKRPKKMLESIEKKIVFLNKKTGYYKSTNFPSI